jgi:hypothetical protein
MQYKKGGLNTGFFIWFLILGLFLLGFLGLLPPVFNLPNPAGVDVLALAFLKRKVVVGRAVLRQVFVAIGKRGVKVCEIFALGALDFVVQFVIPLGKELHIGNELLGALAPLAPVCLSVLGVEAGNRLAVEFLHAVIVVVSLKERPTLVVQGFTAVGLERERKLLVLPEEVVVAGEGLGRHFDFDLFGCVGCDIQNTQKSISIFYNLHR